MKEILLTSSVLILALLALRRVFRRTVSRRLQYALWGLVLLRLLIPVSLPAAGFSLLTAAEPAVRNLQAVYALPERETIVPPEDAGTNYLYETPPDAALGPAGNDNVRTYTDHYGTTHATQYKRQFTLSDLLNPVWYGGMTAMACWLIFSNLSFWRKLRKHRIAFDIKDTRYPVWLVPEGLPSPCLFGLFRPAIYLTPAAVSNPERLRHVLAHEETHGRHLDPLWSLLRGVCLTVYWFDPLVWWAALASRTDCELACDEGTLRRLGADQRIPYGQTLLSLVPVRKTPENPLLSATTMTAGKRQLKDRITRIAENRKNWGIALFAVVSLTAIVCAVTFTGAKSPEPEPLSEEEIAWFNHNYFNGGDFNMRNQFLVTDYERPEDIQLFAVFFNGTGTPSAVTEEERQAVVKHLEETEHEFQSPDDELIKITRDDMNRCLLENINLSLEDTAKMCIEYFTYLEEYDAYYHFHNIENYRGNTEIFSSEQTVNIVSGERDRDLIRLYYYKENHRAKGWNCVTLRQIGDVYYFVSNLPWNAPVVYPNAIVSIPMDGLQPKEFQPVEPLAESFSGLKLLTDPKWANVDPFLDPYCLMFMTDGRQIYAGVQNKLLSSLPQPFLNLHEEIIAFNYFEGILGHDGFTINYIDPKDRPVRDYYFLTKDGKPVLLARCGQDVQLIDLDGDDERELVSCPAMGENQKFSQMLFRRNGKIYEADIRALVESAWPEAEAITFEGWDPVNRCLGLSAFVPYDTSDGPTQLEDVKRIVFRALYYDGADLLLTEDPRSPADDMDHMMGRYDAPADVIAAARSLAESEFNRRQSEGYDDWRVSTLLGPYEEITGGKRFEIWQMDYELHIPSPEVLSGSAHLSEPTWTVPRRPCYLIFQTDYDGNRTLFTTFLESDSAPGTDSFRTSLLNTAAADEYNQILLNVENSELVKMFLSQPETTIERICALPDINEDMVLKHLANGLSSCSKSEWDEVCARMWDFQWDGVGLDVWRVVKQMVDARMDDPKTPVEALERMAEEKTINMTLLTADGSKRYDVDPKAGNGPNRVHNFPDSFDWQFVDGELFVRNAPKTLMLISRDGNFSLHFYEGTNLVLLHTLWQDKWFAAMPWGPPSAEQNGAVFRFMRVWYDEAEHAGLTANIRVPDVGQSQEAVAKAWADAYEGAMTNVTPGSIFACTYVRNEEISFPDWLDEFSPEELDRFYPENTAGHERFAFRYKTVFVPENDGAMNNLMAGNTGGYEGEDAPEGALEYTHCGYMYQAGGYWYCDGVGTGW